MLGRFDPDLFIKQPKYKKIINHPNAEAKNSAQFYIDELKEIPNISEDTGRRLDSISFDISEAKTADDITRAIDEIDSLSRDLVGSDFASGGRIGMFAGLIAKGAKAGKAGQGKFTKLEVLIQRLTNSIKTNKDPYVQENFPKWIKELKAKPELAKR